ncbi:MAG: hypothetical protein DHS20C17_06990 [Cyclobacteriaceae bacterium]|nr:MAG: hypothetical protein DHS20C17_06990 [Cyclobacteriaceae bacterium]
MSKFFKIAIIGSGNVAWHLARVFEDSGHFITDIYSRRTSNANDLARRLYDTNVTRSLDLRDSAAEIFVLAVSDNAIEEVAGKLKVPPYALVVHTSGTQPLALLTKHHDNSGIFYPLQTFSKGISVNFREVPICIEAKHRPTEKILHRLGESISNEVYTINSEDRKILHVSAVFACNFSNHMFTIAQDILEEHEIDFSLLHPLIAETVNKALSVGPVEAQTGPAMRDDDKVVREHSRLLKYDSAYRKIYKLLSEHLKESYS